MNNDAEFNEAANGLRNDLRVETVPVAAKFLPEESVLPEKVRRPSPALGKRIAFCRGVTTVRNSRLDIRAGGRGRQLCSRIPHLLETGTSFRRSTEESIQQTRRRSGITFTDLSDSQRFPSECLAPLHTD